MMEEKSNKNLADKNNEGNWISKKFQKQNAVFGPMVLHELVQAKLGQSILKFLIYKSW